MEILGISLGIDQYYFREYFEDGNAIVRANFYPTCPEPGLTLGIGPHSDPTSVTILHQDEVGGLEVFVDNKWRSIRPRHDAFVINLGDTFMVWSILWQGKLFSFAVYYMPKTLSLFVFFSD